MFKLKAPLIIAGATCFLSMLIGLISGVQFITILGRGLIAGIGAGGFVFLARVILERSIPDLFTLPPQTDTADTMDAASGINVNITLDDDSGLSIEEKDISIESSMAADPKTSKPEADTTAHSVAMSTEQNSSTPDTGNTSVTTAPMFSSDAISSSDKNTHNTAGISDLPDMGSFMASSDELEPDTTGTQPDTSTSFSVEDIQTGSGDSKLMAHAIRTVLATED